MATIRRETRGTSIWAFILIALGVIWLLFQANIISGANLAVLFRLWPLLLIALGLELLIGRNSRSISLLIGGGTVALLLVLMIVGPAIGLAPNLDVQTKQLQEPLGDTTSAQLDLGFAVGQATVSALTNSTNLLTADLRYVGGVDYSASGSQGEKHVSLSSRGDGGQIFDFLGFSFINSDKDRLRWNIGLTTAIPLDLRLNGGVGDATIDLSGVQLSNFSYDNGVGNATITLPNSGGYPVAINGGVGNTTVVFANAAIVASVDGGVGNLVIDVPDDAAVQLNKDGGLGSIHLPDNFERISGKDNNGVWESASYSASTDNAILINYSGGVGDLTIR